MCIKGIDEIWAADLVDMQSFSDYNDGVKYLLAVVDIFSKHGWMVPLKQKTGAAVAADSQSILMVVEHLRKLRLIKVKNFITKT